MANESSPVGTVLLVEDDYLIAITLSAALELLDRQVLGPFPSVATAQRALNDGHVAAVAMLDVNLGGKRFRSSTAWSRAALRSCARQLATKMPSRQGMPASTGCRS